MVGVDVSQQPFQPETPRLFNTAQTLLSNIAQGFTVGLFSVLDAYFDCEMKQLLADLPLAPEILLALTEGQGYLGKILQCVMSYERGEWNQIENSCFEPHVLRQEYFLSTEWANDVMKTTLTGNEK